MSKMKNVITWALCLSLLVPVFMLTSCEKEQLAKIMLTAKSSTETTVAFAVSPENAVKAAYLCIVKGEATPDAATILSTGTAVDATKTTEHTVEGLEPETTYVVYAAAENSEGKAAVAEPVELTTLAKGEQRIVVDKVLEATYIANEMKGYGNYFLALSNAQPNAETGKPVNVGDMIITLDLYNAVDSDPLNALLPAGVYEASSENTPFSWYAIYTTAMMRVAEGDGEDAIVTMMATEGKVDVAFDKGSYTIKVDLKYFNGAEINATYTGAINFVQSVTSTRKPFSTAQNIKFEVGQGRYFGNWYMPHADDMTLEFFAGEFNNDGQLVDGYMLSVPLFMPKLDDYNVENPPLKEGTYNVEANPRGDIYTYIPFTIEPGNEKEVMGQFYDFGMYLIKVDSKTNNTEFGYITRGTMKVEVSGNKYTITFDGKTKEDIEFKGTFNGQLNIVNKCDNDTNPNNPKRPWSTLTGDHTLTFVENTQAVAYYCSNYLFPNYNSWILYITDFSEANPQGDYIGVEYLVPKDKVFEFEEGTYTISKTPEKYIMHPGAIDYGGGHMLYSWYSDNTKVDSEGYATVTAPLVAGTMKITKVDDKYKFEFDFKDDADNTIKGEWTGAVELIDYTKNLNKAQTPVRAMRIK